MENHESANTPLPDCRRILLAGLGSAALIYLTAGNAPDSPLGNEPENTKMYVHDLELNGGKVSVLADDFMRWFAGLWQGKPLALTVACITLVISSGILLAASHVPSDLESDARGKNNQGGNE